jgi:hypothetical protein
MSPQITHISQMICNLCNLCNLRIKTRKTWRLIN